MLPWVYRKPRPNTSTTSSTSRECKSEFMLCSSHFNPLLPLLFQPLLRLPPEGPPVPEDPVLQSLPHQEGRFPTAKCCHLWSRFAVLRVAYSVYPSILHGLQPLRNVLHPCQYRKYCVSCPGGAKQPSPGQWIDQDFAVRTGS